MKSLRHLIFSSLLLAGSYACGGEAVSPSGYDGPRDAQIQDAGDRGRDRDYSPDVSFCQSGESWCTNPETVLRCQENGTYTLEECLGPARCYSGNEGAHCALPRVVDGGPEVQDGGDGSNNVVCSENNLPPVASFEVKGGNTHQKSRYVVFDASESYDPDYCLNPPEPLGFCENMLNRGIVTYRWDWGDGTSEDTDQPFGLHQFETEGGYLMSLTTLDECNQEGNVEAGSVSIITNRRHYSSHYFDSQQTSSITVENGVNSLADIFEDIGDLPGFNYDYENRIATVGRAAIYISPNATLQIDRETLILEGEEGRGLGIYNWGKLIIMDSELRAERQDGLTNYIFLNLRDSWLFLKNSRIRNVGWDGEGYFPLVYNGLNISSRDSIIQGNEIIVGPEHDRTYGIQLFDALRTRIKGNTFTTYSITGHGIFLEDTFGGPDYNEIIDNEIITDGEEANGINLQNQIDYIIMKNNRIVTKGDNSPGISISGGFGANNTHLLMQENVISTYGENSHGIWLSGTSLEGVMKMNQITVDKAGSHGIWMRSSNDYLIEKNFTLSESTRTSALNIQDGHGNYIVDNELNFRFGEEPVWTIEIWSSSSNNIFRNNFSNLPFKIRLEQGTSNNLFVLNKLTSNSLIDDEGSNEWNTTSEEGGGNFWEVYDEPREGCNDTNFDGYCDQPYSISPGKFDLFPHVKDN